MHVNIWTIQGIAFQEATDEISDVETIQLDFETIKVATNVFSDENQLGQGGFGVVYKVKKITHSSGLVIIDFEIDWQ